MAADNPADAATTGGKKGLGFLKQKAGPLPIGVWLLIGVAMLYYFRTQQAKNAASGPQTDPAGNVGTIDPASGFVYGSPEDLAALQAADQSGGTTGGNAGQTATTGAQTYADNNAWGIAAVNLLVGMNIDATTANQAIQLYLSSQPLTTSQQGDVNLAIQALGPPPTLPGPIIGNPPPVTTPPGGTGGTVTVPKVTGMSATAAVAALGKVGLKAGSQGASGGSSIVNSQTPGAGAKVAKGSTVNLGLAKGTTPPPGGKTGPSAAVPTGLATVARSSHSWQVKWNRSKNATSYHVLCTDMGTKAIASEHDVSATTATFTGLTPSHSYVVDVWAEPESGAKGSGPHAHLSITLPKTG
jgi:hypothetical protein